MGIGYFIMKATYYGRRDIMRMDWSQVFGSFTMKMDPSVMKVTSLRARSREFGIDIGKGRKRSGKNMIRLDVRR